MQGQGPSPHQRDEDAGPESVRRRLSSIFQRPIAEDCRAPITRGGSRRPKIHGSSCQSPRAQRCWRAAATS